MRKEIFQPSVAFITFRLQDLKDATGGITSFWYKKQMKFSITFNQVKSFFTKVVNADVSKISSVMTEKNTRVLLLVHRLENKSSDIFVGLCLHWRQTKNLCSYIIPSHHHLNLKRLIGDEDKDGRILGKGLGQLMIKIVAEILFQVSTVHLLCNESKLEYYKRIRFK